MVSSFTRFSAYHAEYTSDLIKMFTHSPADVATSCDRFLLAPFDQVETLAKIATQMAPI